MDSSIIRGSFPDEEDDLGLQHNRNIGNAGQSEDIIIVVEKAIKGMLERKRFSSSNVGAANYIESESVDQEECDSNIFGENRDTGISVSALSKPVGVAHNVQFDTDHQYGFAAATAEEIRLDNEVFVNYSDSSVRKDFIDNDESFIIDSDVLGSEDVSTEEVLDDLENQGQFEQLSISSLDDNRKLNYGNNCFNNIRNDSVDELPLPAKYASVQNYKKDNKRFVKLISNPSRNNDVNSVEITPSIVCKNNFSQNKNSRKSDSLKHFYESVASNLADDKNDSLGVLQGTSLSTSENNVQDDKNMPVLVNENDVIISPCEEERPPPELTPQNVSPPELTALNMVSPPEFTTKVNEQVIGVVHPFNHENNLNIDNQVSNISGLPILSSNGKPLNPPTDVITRNRLRSHCLDSVINAPRSMIKKQESFSTVILKHDGLKTMAVSTMLHGSIDKSDYIPKEVNMRQGISSGNHYRSAHKGIKHINNEDKIEFIHVNENRMTLAVPIRSIDKVPIKLEASDHVVDKSFNTQNEIMPKGQSIIPENVGKVVEQNNIKVMKNNKSNACYSSVGNVKTNKLVAKENRKNSLRDKSPINMSALPSMPILLSPTMEETQTQSTKTNKGETSRKVDHTKTGRKQTPARSVATPLRSFQRLPIAELALSTPNIKNKKKSKQDELLLSMSITNDNTVTVTNQRRHIKATELGEYEYQTDSDPNSLLPQFSSKKNKLNSEMTNHVTKDSLYKKPLNNAIVKNLHSPDLICSSLEPLTIETKITDSSFKTFDNLLTDLDLDKAQTNPLDESVHSLDPFIKDIQPTADILEVLPGADILDGGITDKEIIITSDDVGLLKSDILEEEEQVLTLEDSTLSILNFFDKDISSSKALECHDNESFESPEKFSNKNDLPFTIPEIKFEEDKVILDRAKNINATNDEKPSVAEKNKLINSIEEMVSKTNSGGIDDLILIPGIDSHDKIKSKTFDDYYPIGQERKKYDDPKSNLLSEIEKINEILDRELANTIDAEEAISDRSPKNPSLSSSSSKDVEKKQYLDNTVSTEISNETNLRVDSLQDKSKESEDCVSEKSTEVSVGSADKIANETNLQVDTLQENSKVSEDRVSDKNTEVSVCPAFEITNKTNLQVDTLQENSKVSEDRATDKNTEVSVEIANETNLQLDKLQDKSEVPEGDVSDKNTEVSVGSAERITKKTNLQVDNFQEKSEVSGDRVTDENSEVLVDPAVEITNKTNLQVDTLQEKSEVSEDRASDKSSEVPVEITNETNLLIDTLQEKSEVSEDRASDKSSEVPVEIANETNLQADTLEEKSEVPEGNVSDKNTEVSVGSVDKIANETNLQIDTLQEKSEDCISNKNTEVIEDLAAKISIETNLRVDTLQEKSEDCVSDKSSEVSAGSCDDQLSSKEVVLMPEETSVVENEIDRDYELDIIEGIVGIRSNWRVTNADCISLKRKSLGTSFLSTSHKSAFTFMERKNTDGDTSDSRMSEKQDKSYCNIRSDKSHGDSNSKLSKDSSFNIKSSSYKNNNSYTSRDPKLFLNIPSIQKKEANRKRKKHGKLKLIKKVNILSSQQKSKRDNNSGTTDQSDSAQEFGSAISVMNKNNLNINIEDDICKRMLQDKVSFSKIKDKDITLSILEKSDLKNDSVENGKSISIKKKRNEDNLIMEDLTLADENEFSPRVDKECLNLNRKHLIKSPEDIERNELKEKKAGLEAIIKKLKSEKNASDEYSDKWEIGEDKMDSHVGKSNENIAVEQENSDSLLSCSSKIETEIIHDNLDAQLEIELNYGKNNSIAGRIELDHEENAFSSIIEKTVSDLVTTTHDNFEFSGKDMDSNIEHLIPKGTNSSTNDNVGAGNNEKMTLPSEKSSTLATTATVNTVHSSPVTIPENQPLNFSPVLISKNSESTSFGNGFDSPTGSNAVTEKTLTSESEIIEKDIDLAKTNDNSNETHVLDEIEIGKLNECATINNIDKVDTDSNFSENEKNMKNFSSMSSDDTISDMDKQKSLSLLVTKSSLLMKDSCITNRVSEYQDQIASDKLPVIANPPSLIEELADKNEKEFMEDASKDKNDEKAPAAATELCPNGGRDDSSLILKNKFETESMLRIAIDEATKNIIQEDKDSCVLNNLSDELPKTVGSVNDKQTSESNLQTLNMVEQDENITVVSSQNKNQGNDVSNSITKTTHKQLASDDVEPTVDVDATNSFNGSQDTEGEKEMVAVIKDCNDMTDHLINNTEDSEVNATQESVSNSENVAEKNDNSLSLANVPPVDDNRVNATEKTFLKQNENPVNTESINITVSNDENCIDVTDKSNSIIETTEVNKIIDYTLSSASVIPIANIENSIKVADETVIEKLQSIENVNNDKSCINVADAAENGLLISNEITKESPSVNLTISDRENTTDICETVTPTVGIENFNDQTNSVDVTKTINEVNVAIITEKTPVSNESIKKQEGIGSIHLNVSDDQNNINDDKEPFSEKGIDSVGNETSLAVVTEVTETTEKILSVNDEGINKPLNIEGVNLTVTVESCIDAPEITETADDDTSGIPAEENRFDNNEKTLSLDNETDVPEVTKAIDEVIDVSETTEIILPVNIGSTEKESINPTVIKDDKNSNDKGETYTEKQRSIKSVNYETNVIHPVNTTIDAINISKTTEETSPVHKESSEKTMVVEDNNITSGDKEHCFNTIEVTATVESSFEQCVERVENNRNTNENNSVENIKESQSIRSACPTDTDSIYNTNPPVNTRIESTDEGFVNINQTVCDVEDCNNTTENVEESISKENANYTIFSDKNDVNVTVKTKNQPCNIENVNSMIKEVEKVKGVDVSLPSGVNPNSKEKYNIKKENSIEVINSKSSGSGESVNARSDHQPSSKVDLIAETNLVSSTSNLISSKLSIPLIESITGSDDIKSSDEKVIEKSIVDSTVGDLSSASMTVRKEADSVFELNNVKSADEYNKVLTDSSSEVLSRNAPKDSIGIIDSDNIRFDNNNTKDGDSEVVTKESEIDLAVGDSIDNSVGVCIKRNNVNQEKFKKVIEENHVEPNSHRPFINKLPPKNLLNSFESSHHLASEASIPDRLSKKRNNHAASKKQCSINVKNVNQKLNRKTILHPQDSGSDKVKFPPKNNYGSSQKIGSKGNKNPENYMREFIKYVDSNKRFQIDNVVSREENTSLLKTNENPALSNNHQTDTIIKSDYTTKSIDKESEIKDAVPVKLKSEGNCHSIDNTKPPVITTDSNLSNNIDSKGTEYPGGSKKEEDLLPVGDGNKFKVVKNNSDLAADATNDNQVSLESGTVHNLRLRPRSRSAEFRESRLDNNEVSKTDLPLGNVINKDKSSEKSPEHSNCSAAESLEEQINNNNVATEETDTNFPYEQENIVTGSSEGSCSKSMASGNLEQLKQEEMPVIEESDESKTVQLQLSNFIKNNATEVLNMPPESKLNSISSERLLSSRCLNLENSNHSALSVNPSQLTLSNSVEENIAESCKSNQFMPDAINESPIADLAEPSFTSIITFPDSTEFNSVIVENSENLEKSEPVELSQGDDSNCSQEESASNVIVANYFQSNILVKPTDSIAVIKEKSVDDKIVVNECVDNNRTDYSVNKINLTQRIFSENKNVCSIKENNVVPLSIVENNDESTKQVVNTTATSNDIKMSKNLRKKKHQDSITSDEIVKTDNSKSIFYEAIQEYSENCIIKEVRIVLEKIVHSVNPSEKSCPEKIVHSGNPSEKCPEKIVHSGNPLEKSCPEKIIHSANPSEKSCPEKIVHSGNPSEKCPEKIVHSGNPLEKSCPEKIIHSANPSEKSCPEKIVHLVNPSEKNCSVDVGITHHKRKRQVLGNSEGVKRPSNTPNDQEEPPSKVLLLHSSKSVDNTNENKKVKGRINLRSKNTTHGKERKSCHPSLTRLDSVNSIRKCMYENKVKRVFIPSNVYNCLKSDRQPSKYPDLEIISVESTERNRRFKRRRRKSPFPVTDDDSDNEGSSSSRRRSERTRQLNKRTKQDKALNSIQSNRNVYGLSLRSSKNEKLTKGKSRLESAPVHEGAVSSSMTAALTTKRHHESELSNEALPKKPNLSNKVSCSNNKPKTDNYLPNKKPIFAQEPAFALPGRKEVEAPAVPAGPLGLRTIKDILHSVVRMRYNQVASYPEEEDDSDDDFIGFEDELPCGCLLESDATSRNCVGYCFIRKKLSYLKRTIELSSKHPSSRRNKRFCTFRPSRQHQSSEEQDQPRVDKSVEIRHETSANEKPFWDRGICYMSLGVEVRSQKNKDKQDCFSSKNVEVTNNRRMKQLVQISDRSTSSVAETDKNREEDSDSSS